MLTISTPQKSQGASANGTTLCAQIVADIKQRIQNGQLISGAQLPTLLALCDNYGVSTITVRAALKELSVAGYIHSRRGSGIYVRGPRHQERNLRGEKVLALVVGVWDSPFYAGIIKGAEAECRRQGYRLVLSSSNYDPALEAEHLNELAQQVAGLMVMPLARSSNYSAYAALLDSHTPFVFVDSTKEGLTAPLVATDNEKGGYLATHHLLALQRHPIYALCAQDLTSFDERLAGYRRALREAGVMPDGSWVFTSNQMPQLAGYEMTRSLLKNYRPDEQIGLFCLNEPTSRGAYLAIKEAGLRVPEDVAVVGFDDNEAMHFEPSLTSIHQDTHGLGTVAVQTLVTLLRPGRAKVRRETRLAPTLVVRHSSDPLSDYCPIADLTQDGERLQQPAPVLVVSG